MSEAGSMESDPVVPYADPAGLPPALRAAIEAYAERMGFLPNALKLYMHRPEILRCLIELNNTVMRDESGHLDEGLKRRVAAVCSALNRSPYCVAHNANTLKTDADGDGEGWGHTDAQVRALLDPAYEPDDPVESACLAFARAATRDPSDVPQAVIARLTDALTPPQAIELACVVGFWRMYNAIHESLYVPLEDELLGGGDFNSDELLGETAGAGRVADGAGRAMPAAQARVEIYTMAGCSFCRRAKRMLEGRGAAFAEYRIESDETLLAEMVDRSGGRRTVPQIFIDGAHKGGMDDLQALAKTGELDTRLGTAAWRRTASG